MREQIKKFCILNVKMQGFKKFKEAYGVNLDRIAYVFGSNGEGKTTIADAIAYAFCSSPFWGEHSSDKLINRDSKEMSVEVKFVDENCELHTLIRGRKNEQTYISLDGLQMRQKDIIQVFAEKDIFLSILNPLYFIERIAEDGREFLQRLLPPIEHKEILNLLGESTKALLENETIIEPESYIKNCRSELKEIKDNQSYYEGQLDILKPQKANMEKRLEAILKEISEILPLKDSLEKKHYEGIDIDGLRKRQHEISASLSEGRRDSLLEKRAEVENRQYVSKLEPEIEKLKAEITQAREKCKNFAEQANSIKPGDECSFCHSVISEERHTEIIAKLRAEYNDMAETGKKLVNQYNKLMEIEQKSKETFAKFHDEDLQRINAELESANTGNVSEIAMLEDRIKFGNLTEAEFDKLAELTKQLEALNSEANRLQNDSENEGKIATVEKQLKYALARETELVKLINAANMYAAARAELSLEKLKMNRAAISLFTIVKSTGEIKDSFNFTYDGKDYRWLSASEKIKAGLEVAKLIARLTGLQYPTFIDNAECITTKLDNMYGQVILAYARNSALGIQTPQRNVTQMKEAA